MKNIDKRPSVNFCKELEHVTKQLADNKEERLIIAIDNVYHEIKYVESFEDELRLFANILHT